jgi:hypothetical protein
MNTLVIALSRAEFFALTWAVRLVGVLGVLLALLFLGGYLVQRILRWLDVYAAFRDWYITRGVEEIRAAQERRRKADEAKRANSILDDRDDD